MITVLILNLMDFKYHNVLLRMGEVLNDTQENKQNDFLRCNLYLTY